jgi:ABC-type multidrug transport system ATPase subunit/pSer/pThr/pTyr-binding forkhead associated (FHA) protein
MACRRRRDPSYDRRIARSPEPSVAGSPHPGALILESPADGVRRLAPGGPYLIGRDPAVALRLGDPTVSKVHAALSHDGGAWLLEDRGSFNGTRVNGAALTGARRLRDGDTIALGDTRLTVRLPAAGPDATRHDPDPSPRPGTGAPVALPAPGADPVTIGRAPDNRIVLADPMVSAHHARLVRGPAGPVIEDLGSYNGTFVDDRRVRSAALAPGARVRVGNTRLELDATVRTVVPARAVPALRAEAAALLADDGSTRLAPASLTVSAGELVAILGPAGAGKSTLMNVLAGRVRPSSGHVTVGGQDLAAAMSELAYVPQDDIVHRDLTPREALSFAAGLRLPPDQSRAEIRAVVDRLLATLDLEDCADRVIHEVSGGQRKRASAAMELVGDPRLLFMDEPAAGLDAAHDRDLMAVLRGLADDGRAVVLTTHNTWHLAMCDRLLLVGRGGVLRYDGPPGEVEARFGVATFTDVYDVLDVPPPPTPPGPAPAPPPSAADAPRPRVVGRHVRTLARRNLRILTRDARGLLVALLAAPAMAALAVALFGGEALRRAPGSPFDDINLLLALALVATWLGAFAGLRAIVPEALAWRRERAIGVAPGSYLMAKWLVHGTVVLVQSALIAVAAFGVARSDLPRHTLVLIAVTIAATALAGLSAGLAVSAVSRTEARAITLVLPYVVLQFFFAGVVVPVREMGVLKALSAITSARWGVAGLGSATDVGRRPPSPTFSDKYGDGFFAAAPAAYLGAIAAIAVATALLTLLFVRRAGAPRA